MKTGIFILLIVIFSASPGSGEAANPQAAVQNEFYEDYVVHPELPRVTAEKLKKLMDEKGDFILIDAQDSGSYGRERINGAINIPYDPTGDPMSLSMTLMALPMDKLLIIYCNCDDDGTSAGLVLELYDTGYDLDNIKILSGGIISWKAKGYPVAGSAK